MSLRWKSGWQTAVVAAMLLAGCATSPPSTTSPAPSVERSAPVPLHPPSGALNDDVTQSNIRQTICVSGWTATVRPSTSYTNGLKARLLREQGLPRSDAPKYELDHLIPLALGGHPRKPENLWLQSWTGEWNAHVKDRLEVKLKTMVCKGQISLQRARHAIATDWVAAFKRYVSVRERDVELLQPVD